MEPESELSPEQPNSNSTNVRSTKYDFCFHPKLNCNDDYRYETAYRSWHVPRNAYVYFPKSWERVTEPILVNSKVSSYLLVDTPWRLANLLFSSTRFRNDY